MTALTPSALAEIERLARGADVGASWRARGDERSWRVETKLPCINGLSAWFTLAVVYHPDEAEIGYSDGAIGGAEDRAAYIAALSPSVALAMAAEIGRLRAALEDVTSALSAYEAGERVDRARAALRALDAGGAA